MRAQSREGPRCIAQSGSRVSVATIRCGVRPIGVPRVLVPPLWIARWPRPAIFSEPRVTGAPLTTLRSGVRARDRHGATSSSLDQEQESVRAHTVSSQGGPTS